VRVNQAKTDELLRLDPKALRDVLVLRALVDACAHRGTFVLEETPRAPVTARLRVRIRCGAQRGKRTVDCLQLQNRVEHAREEPLVRA